MVKNILVVDDMKMNRKIIKGILSKTVPDVVILEAEDGFKAMEIVETESVSVIILDIMMPGKDGIQVLEEMKNNAKYKNIPVIMCTAVHEFESVEKALSLGALDYFTKPLTEEQMRITLPLKVKNALEYYEQKNQLIQFYDRVKDEMQLAEQLQKSLIAEYGEFEEVDMWGRYVPSEEVGGDIFCCKKAKGKLWFMMADISGHGISAAMVSTMLNVVFNTSIGFCQNPGAVLQNINKTLYEVFGGSKHGLISAFVGAIEGKNLQYCNAGHPYPVFYKKESNTVGKLYANGFLLGMFEEGKYETQSVTVGRGDSIVLYTDGIFDKGEVGGFGKWTLVHEFCELHKSNFSEDLSDFLDDAMNYFAKHGDTGFIDDVAIMAIRVR